MGPGAELFSFFCRDNRKDIRENDVKDFVENLSDVFFVFKEEL